MGLGPKLALPDGQASPLLARAAHLSHANKRHEPARARRAAGPPTGRGPPSLRNPGRCPLRPLGVGLGRALRVATSTGTHGQHALPARLPLRVTPAGDGSGCEGSPRDPTRPHGRAASPRTPRHLTRTPSPSSDGALPAGNPSHPSFIEAGKGCYGSFCHRGNRSGLKGLQRPD